MSDDRIVMKLKGDATDKIPPEIKGLVEVLRERHPNFSEDRLLSMAWYMKAATSGSI